MCSPEASFRILFNKIKVNGKLLPPQVTSFIESFVNFPPDKYNFLKPNAKIWARDGTVNYNATVKKFPFQSAKDNQWWVHVQWELCGDNDIIPCDNCSIIDLGRRETRSRKKKFQNTAHNPIIID